MPRNYIPVIGSYGCDGKVDIPIDSFEYRDNETVRDLDNNQIYSIKELLTKNILFSWGGPLQSFSNFELTVSHEIQYGILTPLLLENLKKFHFIPDDYVLYATDLPAAIAGGINDPLGLIQGIFFENIGLNILSCTNTEQHLGTKVPITITLYFYKNINQAWQYVLYQSLHQYSIKNHQLALVLLVSSMDILTKELLVEDWPPKIGMRLKHLRARICETDMELNGYNKHLKHYEKKVQKLRNSFEHEYLPVNIDDLQQAYKICFGLFWALGKINPKNVQKSFEEG